MPIKERVEAAGTVHNGVVIPPYAESPVWQRNKHKAGTDMVRTIRFLSWIREDVSPEKIDQLLYHDRRSHQEALRTEDLLFYEAAEISRTGTEDSYPGEPDDYKENSCGWRSIEASLTALHGPDHIAGKTFALDENIYDDIYVEVMDSNYIGDGEYTFDVVRTITLQGLHAHRATMTAVAKPL